MHLLSGEQFFGLFEGELGAFDVCGVVGFKQERALAHAGHPLFGQCSSLQESSSAFDGCQIAGDGVGDSESWVELGSCSGAGFGVSLPTGFFADFSGGFGHRCDFWVGRDFCEEVCSFAGWSASGIRMHLYTERRESGDDSSGKPETRLKRGCVFGRRMATIRPKTVPTSR